MAEAAGALYAVETMLEGALAAAKGIYNPTLPLKATITQVKDVAIPRFDHSATVVRGRVYIFGGVTDGPQGEQVLADTKTDVIILPVSNIEGADYTQLDSKVSPSARQGHVAASIDNTVYLKGGADLEGKPADADNGTVWALDTAQGQWTELIPMEGTPRPEPRINACIVAVDQPRHETKASADIAPQLEVDPARPDVLPEPEAEGSYGSIIIAGGKSPSGQALNDVWIFDIATRIWAELPSGPADSGIGALTINGSRLFLYAGSGKIFHLDLIKAGFNDKGGAGDLGLSTAGYWTELDIKEGERNAPLGSGNGAGLEVITTGQGRWYLALLGGEDSQGKIHAMQIQPEGMTGASFKDAARSAIKKGTGESKWSEVKYYDAEGVMIQEGQDGRGIGERVGFVAEKYSDEDGGTIFVHGGRIGGAIQGTALLITLSI